MKAIGSVLVCLAALGACDNVESYEVATEDMRLFMDVRVGDDAVAGVLVQLTTHNDALLEETFVNLAGGDQLAAHHAGNDKGMTEEHIVPLGIYQYVADCAGVIGGEEIAVSLERPREQDAPNSSVFVPDDFAIDDPGPTLSRAAGLAITWDDSAVAETTRVSISGECIVDLADDYDGNPGGIDIAPGEIEVELGNVSTVECPLTIEVVMGNEGTEHAAFGRGGNVHAYQVRTVEMTSVQ